MPLQGKSIFINDLSACEGGDASAIAEAAKAAGLSPLIVKIAEADQPLSVDPIIKVLRGLGMPVWGWHHVRGTNPLTEAQVAIERVSTLDLQGYVVNAEVEYEQPGRDISASQFMTALRESLAIPIALSSFAFPNFHADFPWAVFLDDCTYHMPKVFWEEAHNAGEQLRESRTQCDALPHARPYLPIAAAYRTTNWSPQPSDINDFLAAARELDLPAVSFFCWDLCRKYLPDIWQAIAEYSWEAAPVPPANPVVDSFPEEFISALNGRDPARMAALYGPEAARTWADLTARGETEIRNACVLLFQKMPAGMVFSLSTCHVEGNVLHLTWKAGPFTGHTTFVLQEGKILQDHTFIAS